MNALNRLSFLCSFLLARAGRGVILASSVAFSTTTNLLLPLFAFWVGIFFGLGGEIFARL